VLPDWSLATVVHALQALRGIAQVPAATPVAELGDVPPYQSSSVDGVSRPVSI
jgi:hypothetical protein